MARCTWRPGTGSSAEGTTRDKKGGFLGAAKIMAAGSDDSLKEDDGLSIKVRIAYEGASGDTKDELTDHTRWLDDVIYPDGKLAQRLESIGGVPIDLDNNFDGDYSYGAIGHRTRLAFEALDPPLGDGVQIYWVKDQDGVVLENTSKYGKSVLYAENARDLTLDVKHGTLIINDHQSEVTFKNGSGEVLHDKSPTPFIADKADPRALRIDPDDRHLLDGVVDGALLSPADVDTIRALQAKGADAAAAVVDSEEPPFGGWGPEEKLYIFREVLKALPPPEQGDAAAPGEATTASTPNDGTVPPGPAPDATTASTPNASGPSSDTSAPAAESGTSTLPTARAAELERYTESLIDEMLRTADNGTVSVEAIEGAIDSSIDPATGEVYLPPELAHMHAHVATMLSGGAPPTTEAPPAERTPSSSRPDARSESTTSATNSSSDAASSVEPRAPVPDAPVPGTPVPSIPVPSVPVPPAPDGAGPAGGAASEWELMAQDARVSFTVEIDGEPRFDDDAFFDTLYGDPALLERLGSDALDYIGARTIELAMRGGLEPIGGEAA